MGQEERGFSAKTIGRIIAAAVCVIGVILAVVFIVKARTLAMSQTTYASLIREYYETYSLPVIETAAEESGFSDLTIEAKIISDRQEVNHVRMIFSIKSKEIDRFADAGDHSPEAAVLAKSMKTILGILYEALGPLEVISEPGNNDVAYVSFEGNYGQFKTEDLTIRFLEIYGREHDFSGSWASGPSGGYMELSIDDTPVDFACEHHVWDQGVVTVEPDYKNEGQMTYCCEQCGMERTETVPKLEAAPGDIITLGNGKYKVLNAGAVRYMGAVEPEAEVHIPAAVNIGENSYAVTSIASGAFRKDETLTTLSIGANVKTIGDNAFYKCTALETVKIGAAVRTIGEKAFCGCIALKTVSMGEKVTAILDQAFYKCSSLPEITVPAAAETIGIKAFCGCKKMKTVTIRSSKLTTASVGAGSFAGLHARAVVRVPESRINGYRRLLKKRGLDGENQTVRVLK